MANVSLNRDQQALVDILCHELADLIEIDPAVLETGGPAARALLEELELHLDNLGNGADLVGLSGLRDCCHHLAKNFAQLAQKSAFDPTADPGPLPENEIKLLTSWGLYLLGYLQAIGNGDAAAQAAAELVTYLADPEWPVSLNDEEQLCFLEHFQSSELCTGDESSQTQLPESITEEMVSYRVSDDVRPELLQGLLAELPEQVNQFDRSIHSYLESQQFADLVPAQRLAHTIKGSANVVGIVGAANLMHYTEDLLEAGSANPQLLTNSFHELLLDIADCLAAASDYLAGFGDAPDTTADILQRLIAHIKQLRAESDETQAMGDSAQQESGAYARIEEDGGQWEVAAWDAVESEEYSSPLFYDDDDVQVLAEVADAGDASQSEALAGIATASVDESPVIGEACLPAGDASVAAESEPSAPDNAIEHKITIGESLAQELLRIAGETQIGNTQMATRIEGLAGSTRTVENHLRAIKALSAELEHLVEVQGSVSTARAVHGDLGSGPAEGSFEDPLEMERYNELHSFSHKLLELTTDSHESIQRVLQQVHDLKETALGQQQLNKDNQQLVLQLRMVPVSTMAARFQRCVRQACRLTGKQAQLEIEGLRMQMDSRVLHKIADPIMHLLRNAVDHGLEASEMRKAAGKSAEGQLRLRFQQTGEIILIECIDDGAGLDYPRIAQVARERGLADDGLLDQPNQLRHLVLMPGFSTRRSVSQTSGRGIGLDVVAAQVRELKGNLSIDSEPGQGCRFSLMMPSSILSAHLLLVRCGGIRSDLTLGVVSRSLEQVVYLSDGDLIEEGHRLYYRSDKDEQDEPVATNGRSATTAETQLPVYDLNDLIQIHRLPSSAKPKVLLICRRHDGSRFGVAVETVIASQDMVIKPLGEFSYKPEGVVGATILGDGRVAPVIDLQDLPAVSMEADQLALLREQRLQLAAQNGLGDAPEKPLALVVDDSLSARRALSQFLSDLGMEVATARDGFEAIELINRQRPVLLLVDLEMPRMNGLELTTHVRSKPELRDLPVIMITSRTTEKHRQMAASAGVSGYLNKPWSDDELLSSIQQQIA